MMDVLLFNCPFILPMHCKKDSLSKLQEQINLQACVMEPSLTCSLV